MRLASLIKSGLVLLGLAVFQDGPAENCILVFLGHKVSSACSCTLHQFWHLDCSSDTIFFKLTYSGKLRGSRSGTACLNLACLRYWCSLNLSLLALASGLCQAVGIAKKHTKADRLQRQTEQLEKRLDRRPDEIEKKKTTREDLNQAAAQTVREVTEGR